MQELEGVEPRSLPQTTIRKVIKHCLENGVFDTILVISYDHNLTIFN